MGHSHAGHTHHISPEGDRRRLAAALAVMLAVMAVEIVGGVVGHSLALLSDAAHMLADAAALGLSLLALQLAARPARGAMTFGFSRAEVLSAQANGITLVILAAFIAYEAISRLVNPPHVDGTLMLVIALGGIAANTVAARLLAGAERRSLNIEGSFQHVLTDLYAALATAAAAVLILAAGLERADPIASLLIAAVMIRAGASLVWASVRVFLEAAPAGVDPEEIGSTLASQSGVVEVHDLHVWEITSGFPALSAHVLVGPDRDCHELRRRLEALLHERFGLDHTTLQVDHRGEDLLEIAPAPTGAGVSGGPQPDRA
ncbi:MAG TPA: cation diffusion facilitator family transporter [Solirubrobacteraceae bacterium]|nr:cation diffusion facilitator family transporter [Solirubrobacteraceae bacterium]